MTKNNFTDLQQVSDAVAEANFIISAILGTLANLCEVGQVIKCILSESK
eukprot:CAMPEP_0116948254 /NCGR_PEP_ID=MMETSP0467-20121206/38212_1 /TAXON_ID=283647 /ORGANISM="Mesodinium pulex, Strain SPMC105" /LENGTH=48 /DNA_ID= /DNA_START= /DNA_END= /DNA_ORIENTATION=